MNYDSFLIAEEDLQLARDICKYVDDTDTRNRAVANVISAHISKRYFQDYDVDIESGLHNAPCILEDLEISDAYILGNYIDVRISFEGDSLSVPAEHFKRGILPVAYMFVEVQADLSGGFVLGFIKPDDVDTTSEVNGYYVVDKSNLVSFSSIEFLLDTKYDLELSADLEEQIYDYIETKSQISSTFYNNLISSKTARLLLIDLYNAKNIFRYVSLTKETDTDFIETVDEVSFEDNLAEEGLSEFVSEDVILANDSVETFEEEISDFSDVGNLEEVDSEDTSDYSTMITPSLSEIENASAENDNVGYEQIDNDSENAMESVLTEKDLEDSEAIEELFNESGENISENISDDVAEQNELPYETYKVKTKKTSILPLLGIVVLLSAGVYFGLNKTNNTLPDAAPLYDVPPAVEENKLSETEAMPVETIENDKVKNVKEEGNSVAIPAIEKNLDASILVDNLNVKWEVPASYASNNSAKRYFTKIGKIIQLNLKTEMLLLSRPPINNKVTVELKFNKDTKKFEANEIIVSSGESSIDSLILDVVKNSLNMNLNINISSFANANETPVLIISF